MAEATKKMADGAGKDLPTPAPTRRTGIIQFLREVYREGYEKVSWPSWKETYLTTIMVFIMVILTMMFFFLIDLVLSGGENWILRAAG
ncbi:MAG TPA: preprotein translocase subunit SecE [Rhizomicrobium sp.]|nr:preprotein translocase subunit SecE [Rhizomicrobium sp.]